MAALDLRLLAATDFGWLAAVTSFSGTAESGQNSERSTERNQLQNSTHVVSLFELSMVGSLRTLPSWRTSDTLMVALSKTICVRHSMDAR